MIEEEIQWDPSNREIGWIVGVLVACLGVAGAIALMILLGTGT